MSWKNRIIGYDTKPANQFTANPLNFRRHPVPQREALRGLLGEVGWVGAVLENVTTGNLIDGHARIEEALSKDEETPIPFLKVELTEAEEKLVLASFDPISAMATADKETLDLLLKDVATSSEAVEKMLADLAKENGLPTSGSKDAEPQIDKAEELRQKWGTETGQLWVIGSHRLLVGDATNKADVGRLCANEKVSVVLTDPPYSVNYSISFSKREGGKNPGLQREYKEDNNAARILSFLDGCPDLVVMTYPVDRHLFDLVDALKQSRFVSVRELVWVKSSASFHPGQTYQQKHEPILVCRRKGTPYSKATPSDANTVVEYTRTSDHDDHPTEKPMPIWCQLMDWHSFKGNAVYDPFAGSGTTLVAAENLNRKCYAMEISPAYVAVCLERMTTAFPHLKIEKVDQARAA